MLNNGGKTNLGTDATGLVAPGSRADEGAPFVLGQEGKIKQSGSHGMRARPA